MKRITLSLMAWLFVACNDGAAVKEEIKTSQPSNLDNTPQSSNSQSDSSEGVVGPDDAYFAGVYLESVFKASKINANPELKGSLSLGKSKAIEAFDYAANFQDRRLDLMSRIVLKLGDKDKDEKLSSEEFLAIQLIPELQGSAEAVQHEFNKEFFDAAAGEDELLSQDEIKSILVKLSEQSGLSKLSKAEIRKALESGWEKVLALYDEDKDGKLSLSEQKKLRSDRASIVKRFN